MTETVGTTAPGRSKDAARTARESPETAPG